MKRLGIQLVGLSLLMAPSAILGFADDLGRFFIGSFFYVGYERHPLGTGIAYLTVTAGLAAVVRLGIATWTLCQRTESRHSDRIEQTPRRSLLTTIALSGDPFASRPIIFVFCAPWAAILFSLTFGYLALGAKYPEVPFANTDVIKQRAEELWGQPILEDNEPLQASLISGFAVTTYEIRSPAHPVANAPNTVEWTEVTYEEYGFPLRCLRTPIEIGIPRPGVRRLFFDANEDHFIWKQLTNIHLLPFQFAADTSIFAAMFWFIWSVPSLIHRKVRTKVRERRGCCTECGYILHGLPRCPECGTVSDVGQASVPGGSK